MKLTPLRQAEYETSIAVSASRTPIIDAAVCKLQGQMEEVLTRQARYDRVLEEAGAAIKALLHDLREIEEQSND
jgi:hypothetical protein|tara:strand:- start:331 stop:552 length:222 start_codon:yes stop_codon:yes gene_type:complete